MSKVTRIQSREPEVLICAIKKADSGETIITPDWIVTMGTKLVHLPRLLSDG